ncbi:MAG: DUF1684 domain-containing protein [Bacteroidota bacterium]
MTRNKILLLISFIVLVVIIVYSVGGDYSPEEYVDYIKKEREEQERFMRYNEESPFVMSKVEFSPLHHYPADLKYRVKGRFEAIEAPRIRSLGTNDGKQEQYMEYGYALFELDGKADNRLLIFENVTEEKLFLAFGDATSAIETYGAGRYLDIEHSGGETIKLDFNLAYNPYCAYIDNFSCPLPPRENLLEIAIKAGEKNYH